MEAFPEVFSIVDTETTGMRPPFSRVMDLGIIRVEHGVVVERFETLLNPGTAIPPSIRHFTNIREEDLIDAPSFEEVALSVEALLKDSVFVAHNAAFDYGFMRSEFDRLGMRFSAERLCTVALSRELFPHAKGHSLDAIIARCNLSAPIRHRALPDAEAVHDFLTHLSQSVAHDTLRRAVENVQGRGVGKRLPNDSLGTLPNSSGVYFFYGPEDELLYIGKSKNMRTRARSHFRRTDMQGRRITDDAAHVQGVATSGELSALILESSLIKKELPLYNRALRKRKVLAIARRVYTDDGYARAVLERTDSLTPGEDILAVFRTTTQGKGVLRTLAKEYKLCPKLLGAEESKGACFGTQIGTCEGACKGTLAPQLHNDQFEEAFRTRRIKTWPYKGAVLITEAESETKGTVFVIDNWILKGSFTYEGDDYAPLVAPSAAFDYDTYKILARYMLHRANKKNMKVISKRECDQLLAQGSHEYEPEMRYVLD
ncbi:MAG TPA: exonuclease domain-containing protein [Candidatus Paceibacterota bacterium]|nr:exonuclease domain-containing protein [Candidatus Paceibacterota bacterium]